MAKVSIIIRAKNEERWLPHCLMAVKSQSYADHEIILVDNNSADHTVDVARRFDVDQVVTVDRFLPGLAINQGVRASTGDYLCILSAHCVPTDDQWLAALVEALEEHDDIAGAYGRQLPISFTNSIDKRDLLTVFGLDRRIQVKDHFFHNANSLVRRSCWEAIPFDETVTNVEDRIWGKAVIAAGHRIAYTPDAAVYHHHGLNHGNDERRATGVVSVIEQIDPSATSALPTSLKPEHCVIAALIPVVGDEIDETDETGERALSGLIQDVVASRFVDEAFVVANAPRAARIAAEHGATVLERAPDLDAAEAGIGAVLSYGLESIEARGLYPQALLFADWRYPRRPEGLFDQIIWDAQYNGFETVFPGYVDYQNYWRRTADDADFEAIGDPLLPRSRKKPLYRALYGLGTLVSAPNARRGELIGGRIGIHPIRDAAYAERLAAGDMDEPGTRS